MNREEKLKSEFNKFLAEKLELEHRDYYSKLGTRDFMELKMVLHNINNIVTLKLTLGFVRRFGEMAGLTEEETAAIVEKVQGVNPNANGFDVEILEPVKMIAEVKGNIPVNGGGAFGGGQRTGILEDLRHLRGGKETSIVQPDDFYKFMVVPDAEAIRDAVGRLFKSPKVRAEFGEGAFEVVSEETAGELRTDVVYVMFVEID